MYIVAQVGDVAQKPLILNRYQICSHIAGIKNVTSFLCYPMNLLHQLHKRYNKITNYRF